MEYIEINRVKYVKADDATSMKVIELNGVQYFRSDSFYSYDKAEYNSSAIDAMTYARLAEEAMKKAETGVYLQSILRLFTMISNDRNTEWAVDMVLVEIERITEKLKNLKVKMAKRQPIQTWTHRKCNKDNQNKEQQ